MLLLLLSGQRGQIIELLDVRNMDLSFSKAVFRIGDVVKQSWPGSHLGEVALTGYAPNRRLCVLTVLKHYLERTLDMRGTITRLLITYGKPFKAASRSTIRRWTKTVMKNAGIDLSMFAPHSTRSASTSHASSRVCLSTILKTAGWARDCFSDILPCLFVSLSDL